MLLRSALRACSPAQLFHSVVVSRSSPRPWDSQVPIREELFGIERLEAHAQSLARAQPVAAKPSRGKPLVGPLRRNAAALRACYRVLQTAIDQEHVITPAAEWLVDNFHLVEKQTWQIRADLPHGYYRQLPKLTTGPFAGYPRVFGIAWAFVAHSDSRFDADILLRYVQAYQREQPLTIGELWAVSITLRIVLIENLTRVARQIAGNREACRRADAVADRLLGVGRESEQAEPIATVMAGRQPEAFSEAFAVQLVYRLRDQDPTVTPALNWLNEHVARQGTTVDALVRDVQREQGASNVTMRNIITSLRLIADVDWNLIFEQMSLVDGVLAEGTVFREMDFPTRNLYRSAIEELARGSRHSESDIARAAVQAAHDATPAGAREADPGYHLLAGGRRAFEAAIGFRPSLGAWPTWLNRRLGVGGYIGLVGVATALLLAVPLTVLALIGTGPVGLGLLGVLGAVPAVDVAIALVNRAMAAGFPATLLAALELREGIPAGLRTLVAVPTMLTSEAGIAEQIEHLEIHHLASPDGDLCFALLSDWRDAASEHTDTDAALLAAASAGIARLNQRYGPAPGGARFLLLHRRRSWNASEARWIGWERKRGKLHELNRLLRGATDTGFITADGAPPVAPAGIRYVVTLDADTRLPRDTVRRLVGKMAHPLNRPDFDASRGRVVEGYAILQPRVTPSLPVGQEGSLFQRIFSGLSGIDPYASAASDVYQDLFGEGSYAGKGIYDVDSFEAALAGRVPDQTMLSHDLFEGVFARAGLVSDVEVVEEFPARYDVATLRHHRWARGDWQLLPWILGRGPKGTRAGIPALGRLKMLDNLRRTLSSPAAVLALLAGWGAPLGAALVWTGFVVSTIVLPTLLPVINAIPAPRPGPTAISHLRALGRDLRLALMLSTMMVTFLGHQAWLMGDAILRTLWRLLVSRRHLLEWVPAAQTGLGRRPGLPGFYRDMAGTLAVAALALLLAAVSDHSHWGLVLPFVALWLAAPAMACRISQPPRGVGQLGCPEAEAQALRQTARRTWRFFETFVTAEENWLPPDNFQEDPTPQLAHRTSPTNLGLYLLSVASAHDFGWIGTAETLARLRATLQTMGRLPRFRGHFFNWYDTRDLRPLEPQYVSTVDSGNLAGHLIALANACREWQARPFEAARPQARAGVNDALAIAGEEALGLRDGRLTQTVTWRQFDEAMAALTTCLAPGTPAGADGLDLAEAAVAAETLADIARTIALERGDGTGDALRFWAEAAWQSVVSHRRDEPGAAAELAPQLAELEATARAMAVAMEFGFLLNRERLLLSIGFLPAEGTLDENCYDLLASEARLASFLAIAKGDVPARHWFRLGRSVVPVAERAALISWSGSMFEYLMPSLVMRAPAGSLLEQTNRLAVRAQIAFGAERGLPWGISESGYNARDLELTYQYSNFGVPGLALKRGLGEQRVVAPYATALAAMVDPRAAAANLARLQAAGARGAYGFCEAVDYTPSRLPVGEEAAVVHSYMAHHQGMTIVALADTLLGGAMCRRFHAEPEVQATALLLQERSPRDVAPARRWEVSGAAARVRDNEPSGVRHFTSAQQLAPPTQLLSNGHYATMLTTAGSGYSRWGDLAVTRWHGDACCDDDGSYLLVRDLDSGEVWSATAQPAGAPPDAYGVTFSENLAVFTRHDGTLQTRLEVLISAEDDAEVRRLSISNTGPATRRCDVTSYAELVLARPESDLAHPAFSKLFVETEYLPGAGAILATRRRRAPDEPGIWAGHLAVEEAGLAGPPEFETDRARFLGRGHTIHNAVAMAGEHPLSNTVGAVLDPIFSLRRRVSIAPGATIHLEYWTLVAATRAALISSIDKHRTATAFARATTLSWTQAQVQLHHLGITAGQASLFQRLAGSVIYAAPTLRPASERIIAGAGAQSGLWAMGIGGDLPIVLLRITESEHLGVARELLQAHDYWRLKQLAVDLVILNERQTSYTQDLQIALETMARASRSSPPSAGAAPAGRVFVLRADLIAPPARALLAAAARVVLVAQRGSLFDQLERIVEHEAVLRRPRPRAPARPAPQPAPPRPDLEFFNGLGGFARDGTEYVTLLGPGQWTPAPWINVIANADFGFLVAAEGGGHSWALNSRENQITPWSNDPVSNRSGEAFYLRDEESGEVWTPTALPIRDQEGSYLACHGRGYSRFSHTAHGIEAELAQFVLLDAPVKVSRLVLRNRSAQPRALGVTGYVEWALGASRAASAPFVITALDPASGALFARNPWSNSFGTRVAFFDMAGRQQDWTGSRREFIGRNADLSAPVALASGRPLSGRGGAGLDPCGALRTRISLAPGESTELVFFLGEAADAEAASALVARSRAADLDAELARVSADWDDLAGAVRVRTPDRALDIMLNGWLLYQTVACRLQARTGFYQASGAYGFRDQLQDGMALVAARPAPVRAHLLRAAGRQFVEGDVQHWWLPHSGQGVRTRISDDRAWLAVAVAQYVASTGDAGVLDERVEFLEGQALQPGEHDHFFQPATTDRTASLFDHCALALDASLGLGRHGLPLMGTGDWNDGMNRVGEGGAGESVWLGWLLHAALTAFVPLARARGDAPHAGQWQAHARALGTALEREAWDGAWYLRGFFDDGTALGASASAECRIDSIAQSWAVLSGAADPVRAARAMAAVGQELIHQQDGVALLFAPPFDAGPQDPGYIKGYPPGLRENGGQYTHAALWSVLAFAALGEGDRAGELMALLNPINHARTRAELLRYKVEPYAVAADVYATAPHVGRGGWTWYTGSAGWMQRAGMEGMLGLRLHGAELLLAPCIPKSWPGFEVSLRFGATRYEIRVTNPAGVNCGIAAATLDGETRTERPLRLPLRDDAAPHLIELRLGG